MSKIIIYHGSKDIIEKPIYHGGKPYNDYGYGFYCTTTKELAKEWSITNNENNGFSNKYSIDTDNLKILDLTDKKYSILNWIAILLKHRTFDLNTEISIEATSYLLKHYYIDITNYDIVIGYRADDSYFTFARDFVNNTISLRQLSSAMELGNLGIQFVLISKKALNKLHFIDYETVDGIEYYAKRKNRFEQARNTYLTKTRNNNNLTNDIFIIDIIRKEIKDNDSSIQ